MPDWEFEITIEMDVLIAMFGWVRHTHSVLGFLWWCLWCLYAEISYGKLLEVKGRVNLGLESENVNILQYADDTVFVGHASWDNVIVLKPMLRE